MGDSSTRHSALALGAYFVLYLVYLFLAINVENEWLHWITLVLLPSAIITLIGSWKGASFRSRVQYLAALLCPSRKRLLVGVMVALALGLILGSLQLLLSRDREILMEALSTGKFLYAFPLAVGLMMLTAGFTEEYFFRGLLQSSLLISLGSKFWAISTAAVAFGLYHLPYAYLLTSWPSHGHLQAAFVEGVIPSVILGAVFGYVQIQFQNVLIPMIAHSVFNACWALKLFL